MGGHSGGAFRRLASSGNSLVGCGRDHGLSGGMKSGSGMKGLSGSECGRMDGECGGGRRRAFSIMRVDLSCLREEAWEEG